ncbi:unnamed protein product [Cuscuta campestris]|uniref:Pentacotripeptide-repeat region of PRORP domain-containing protein n=1 Tax=Cuscuta campestris TaxID=132261 RepID=A0A484KE80_9ASTE|nr:unnamed protein product [Cuscuta campestris]
MVPKMMRISGGFIFRRASRGLSPNGNNPMGFSGFHSGVSDVSTNLQDSYLEHCESNFNGVKKLDDALVLYRHMVLMRPFPPIVKFNQLLSSIVKMGCYSDAVSLFQDICASGVRVDHYTLTVAANSLARLGRVDLGFAILGTHLKLSLVPDVVFYNTLLKGLFLQGRVQDAIGLFKKLLSERLCVVSVVTLLVLIDGLCKAGHTGKAGKLLHLLDEKGNRRPNVFAYSTIIDSLCKDSKVDDALVLLSKMVARGIPPNVVTYTSLIHGLCKFSRWKEVKELLKRMADSKIPLDAHTYTVLVVGFCKEGWVNDAAKTIETMVQEGVEPNVITYSVLMDGYSLQGKISSALKLLNTMIYRGCDPDIQTYNILINGYCKSGYLDKAMQLFEEIPSIGLKPTVVTYSSILEGLFQAGRCADAEKLFNKMVESQEYPDLVTYTILLDGFCKNYRVPQALSLLRMMEANSPAPDIITYNTVIKGLFNDGKSSIAMDLFIALPSKGVQPNMTTYRIMVSAFAKMPKACSRKWCDAR